MVPFGNMMSYTLTAAIYCVLVVESANVKAYLPIRNANSTPHLHFNKILPDPREFTVCLWIKPYYLTRPACIMSFTVPTSNIGYDLFLGKHLNQTIRVITGNGSKNLQSFNCDEDAKNVIGIWRHLCITWLRFSDSIEAFLNGKYCRLATNSTEFHYLSRGVVVRIGQPHHTLRKDGSTPAGWYGDIGDVQLWDEALTEEQIIEAGKCKGKRREGNVINWTKTPMTITGGVVLQETELCSP